MSKFAVILPAAGKSTRFGDRISEKPFAPLDGTPVWLHATRRFMNRKDVVQTILVIAEEDREAFQLKFAANIAFLGLEVVLGGEERSDSVRFALARVNEQAEYIAIHDAARPCIAPPGSIRSLPPPRPGAGCSPFRSEAPSSERRIG